MKTRRLPAGVPALALTACLLAQSAAANTFTNVPIPGLGGGFSVAWGDFDNDGLLDFLRTGNFFTPISQLWRNTGNGFSNVTASIAPGLPGAESGVWGDFDNDGWLDFLVTGQSSTTNVTHVWRNTGSGFTNVTTSVAPGLPQLIGAVAAWGDFDNDGRRDFLITGDVSDGGGEPGTLRSQLWRNTGNGFSNETASVAPFLTEAWTGPVAWSDYDNNGWLDFLLTGYTNGSLPISQLWRNLGGGFANVTAGAAPGLLGVYLGGVAWGDYDNDGRPDFLITGDPIGPGSPNQLRRNTSSGFSNVTASVGLTLVGEPVAWGDYDNDGRLDFLQTGSTPRLWRNTVSGFSNVTASVAPGLPSLADASVAWGDYDNDGRLDFLALGSSGGLWRNTLPVTNAPPTAPTGLAVAYVPPYLRVTWNAATDDHTPPAALTYNLRVGTTPGGSDVLSPMALADGRRLLPQRGNAEQRLFAWLVPQLNQTWYFSVQAVDANFAGSPFSAEQSFSSTPPTLGDGDGDGIVDPSEFHTVISNYWQTSPPMIESVSSPSNTVFQFGLTNLWALNFDVLATTNAALPLNQWENIGPATLSYQFTDPAATNYSQRFYQLAWP